MKLTLNPIALALLFAITIFLSSPDAFADPTTGGDTAAVAGKGISDVLCNVIQLAQGGIGKTIATLIIISMAMGLFLGKITWGVAIAVAVGMGVLFGANTVVGFLAGSKGAPTCPSIST
ncbi:MAG: type IV secretory pathway VirB2 component (pilin) [Candidatus Midichloriaceae bacterium]|jgi:type IV secretory pathway VirB2 component (pilin)